jgi:hypothetical protein
LFYFARLMRCAMWSSLYEYVCLAKSKATWEVKVSRLAVTTPAGPCPGCFECMWQLQPVAIISIRPPLEDRWWKSGWIACDIPLYLFITAAARNDVGVMMFSFACYCGIPQVLRCLSCNFKTCPATLQYGTFISIGPDSFHAPLLRCCFSITPVCSPKWTQLFP